MVVDRRHAHRPDQEVRRGVVADAHREVDEVLDGRGEPGVEVQEHAAPRGALGVGQDVRLIQAEGPRLHAAIDLDHQRDLHHARRPEPAVAMAGPAPPVRSLDRDADGSERLRAAHRLRHLVPVRLHALVSYRTGAGERRVAGGSSSKLECATPPSSA